MPKGLSLSLSSERLFVFQALFHRKFTHFLTTAQNIGPIFFVQTNEWQSTRMAKRIRHKLSILK